MGRRREGATGSKERSRTHTRRRNDVSLRRRTTTGTQVCFEPRDGSLDEDPWFPDTPAPRPRRKCTVPFCRRGGSSDPEMRGLCRKHFVRESPSALARAAGREDTFGTYPPGPPPARVAPHPPEAVPRASPAPGRAFRGTGGLGGGARGTPVVPCGGGRARRTRPVCTWRLLRRTPRPQGTPGSCGRGTTPLSGRVGHGGEW